MLSENVVYLLVLGLKILCFGASKANGDIARTNVITVNEPEKQFVWIAGQSSSRIAWTQSKHCFKWNIELLDNQHNKVLDISTELSEFKENIMSHHWIVPKDVQTGEYRIRVCQSNSATDCGVSNVFSITNKEDFKTADEQDSEVFSSQQGSFTTRFATSKTKSRNITTDDLFPHELRRKIRLEKEREYFKRLTREITAMKVHCSIERVHKPSKEFFVERYMKQEKPVILTGMMDDWDALTTWNFDELGLRLTDGVQVELNTKEGLSPYYRWNDYRIQFASGQREPAKVVMKDFQQIYSELLEDVSFPEFSEDFLELVDEDIRPSQLSFEMTPRRSGFDWRVEPLNASVWSALIVGRKRWGLYPPSQYFVPGMLHNNYRVQDYRSTTPFIWWTYTRPHIHADYTPLECVQEPGEILFIPSGWWWSNINLDDSITMQKSTCDHSSIRACMDELKELADSRGDNYHGDAFVQLRHHLARQDPVLLTDDDWEFKSPIRGLGKTRSEHDDFIYRETWKKYFGEEVTPEYYKTIN